MRICRPAGITALVLLLCLLGCGIQRMPVTETLMPSPPPPQVLKLLVRSSETPTPPPIQTEQVFPSILPHYVIDANMDYDAKTIDVREEIEFTNNTQVMITDMLLAVEPNRIPGVFSLHALRLDDTEVVNYSINGQRLYWKLEAPLQPGKTYHILLNYWLALPVVEQLGPAVMGSQIFGVRPSQVNLTDWYPMLVPFSPSSGWLLAEPVDYGEHMVYPLANFEVILRFANPADLPIIAASAPGQAIVSGWRYELQNGRDFSLAMGRQLRVFSMEVDGVTVSSYYYSGNEFRARAVLNTTAKAIKTFSTLFGPYPHKSLAIVQGDFKDGMEFDGLFYLSKTFYNLYDGTQNNILVMLAAHETSHQWWFGRVASDQANQPWLDEALATYCEVLFYEKNYPASVGWWWAYRIDYHKPWGKIDGDVPSYAGFTPYTNATYRQGARFLEELRQLMGDEAFFVFLKDYSTRMDGEIATPDDFFRILRLHSPADISSLVRRYFARPPAQALK